MPTPTSKYASDNVTYYITNKLSKYLCFTSPNVISIIGFLFIIPILLNYKYNRGYPELIILAFIKQIFDCLDGSVARVCNKTTIFGAKLDIFLDTLTSILVSIYVINILIYNPPKERYKSGILILLMIGVVYNLVKYMYDKESADKKGLNMDKVKLTGFVAICHDNSVLISMITFTMIKTLLK